MELLVETPFFDELVNEDPIEAENAVVQNFDDAGGAETWLGFWSSAKLM